MNPQVALDPELEADVLKLIRELAKEIIQFL